MYCLVDILFQARYSSLYSKLIFFPTYDTFGICAKIIYFLEKTQPNHKFLTIMDKATMDTHERIFVGIHDFISLGKLPRNGILSILLIVMV